MFEIGCILTFTAFALVVLIGDTLWEGREEETKIDNIEK